MKTRPITLPLLAAMFGILGTVPAGAEDQTRSYILMATGNKLPNNLSQAVSDAGGSITRTISEIGVAVASSSDPNFSAQAAGISGIRSVSPDVELQWVTPSDQEALETEFGNPPNSGDNDPLFNLQWGHDAVDAPEAWDLGYRGKGVRVAVLDTGFDIDHPDLAPNINSTLSANFVPGESLTYGLPDVFSHGTHVAGTIAAADNGLGVIGVAPEAELVLVKVLSDAGRGAWDWLLAGIVHAANVDADIINMSIIGTLKMSGVSDFYTAKEASELLGALNRATNYAYQHETTLIAAAGNDEDDADHNANAVHIPSASPHVISIAATAPIGWAIDPTVFLDNPASYTNYGQSVIDFAAPGGDVVYPGTENCTVAGLTYPCWVFDMVVSTGSNPNPGLGSYYWTAGTSMAAPHASGVAAIIIGKNGGDLPPAQVKAALSASADDLGKPGKDDFYGAGRVNAYNAVK